MQGSSLMLLEDLLVMTNVTREEGATLLALHLTLFIIVLTRPLLISFSTVCFEKSTRLWGTCRYQSAWFPIPAYQARWSFTIVWVDIKTWTSLRYLILRYVSFSIVLHVLPFCTEFTLAYSTGLNLIHWKDVTLVFRRFETTNARTRALTKVVYPRKSILSSSRIVFRLLILHQ